MQELLLNIEWATVLVSFVLSFGLGWLWYSDRWFGVQWRAGKGGAVWQAPLWMPMSAQAGSTLLLAIVTNLATSDGHVGHAVLVAVTIAGFIKANGLYSGKSRYAVGVESGFVLAMVAIMVAVNMVL